MHIANQVTRDEDVLIACLFHDILEDVPEKYCREQMLEDFGARVVGFVDDVTKDSSIRSWRKRSEAYLAHLETADEHSVIVSAADKINNLNAMLIDYEQDGEKLWKKFNGDKHQQLWWYESIYTIVRRRLMDSPLREAMGQQMKQFRKIIRSVE
jgi:(p)ppGpp synthase/HD superfamily hydrolase